VGYWPLDGNANAVIGVNGVVISNAVAAADRNGTPGRAMFFDGALQQRVHIPGGGGLNAARQGTISLWVKWTGTQDLGSVAGNAGAVLSRQQDSSFSDDIITLNVANPDNAAVQWRQNTAGGINASNSAIVLNDTWRHIAVTFTEANSQLFVDGFSEGIGSGGALHDNTATPLAIGAWPGGGGCFATATIDDVAVWNRVLSTDEIQLLAGQLRTPLTLLVSPDYLTITRAGANVTVRWSSQGVLQSATAAGGPYLDVANATSPYSPPSGPARFYRLRSP